MMSTSGHSSSNHSRGRSLPRPPLSFDMDVNKDTATFYSSRDRTPSPTKRSPYLGNSPHHSPVHYSPPLPSRNGSLYSHPPLSPSSLGDVKKLNRSSVSYLRNLSELSPTNIEEAVYGLGIPEIDTEEFVPGTAGRKRLARGESQKVYTGGKLWVDKQRQIIQTYEYLCHVGEAKQWMESCLEEEIPPIVQLEEALRNGVILARLAKVFAPDLVPKIFEAPKLQFRHSDNINRFFRFVERCGLPNQFCFELTDLYDKKNIPKVIYCIHALSYILSSQGHASPINDLVGLLEFTEDELLKAQKGLDAAGITLPNFKNVSKELAKEPTPEPSPPPETEEERIDRELGDCEEDVVGLQACVRGWLKRESLRRFKGRLRRAERYVVQVQACARGGFVRSVFGEHLRGYQESVKLALMVQACVRGMLVRNEVKRKVRGLRQSERQITRLQSIVRGNEVRQALESRQIVVTSQTDEFVKVQAQARGYLLRRQVQATKYSLKQLLPKILSLQSLARGYLARQEFTRKQETLQQLESQTIILQSHVRGYLFRWADKAFRRRLATGEPGTALLQARARGMLSRMYFYGIKGWLAEEEEMILDLQSRVRGYLIRRTHDERARHYRENMDKVIKIQSLIRAKQQGEAYKSLTTGKNPPVGTIKNFVHLLNDSNFDFEEEIECERLRKVVVTRVKTNDQAEQDINRLDIMIGLMLKNKIEWDEINSHRGQIAQRLNHTTSQPTSSDPLDLKALNHSARKRLELYEGLFYILQTQPEYLARYFARIKDITMSEPDIKKLEVFVMTLFSYAQKRREEYFLVRLLAKSVYEEMKGLKNPAEFAKGGYMWSRVLTSYIRGTKERKFLRDIFAPLIRQMMSDHALDLECDPVVLFQRIVEDEELRSGRPSSRRNQGNVTRMEACRDPATRDLYIHNLRQLRELTNVFMLTIERNISKIPFGIRYIARQISLCLKNRFPQMSEDNNIKVVANFIYYLYLNSAIKAPESWGVVESVPNPLQRKNLGMVSKMLTHIAGGKAFGEEDEVFQSLNDYVVHESARMNGLFKQGISSSYQTLTIVIDIMDPEDHFAVDQYDDLASTQKPTLTIRQTDVKYVHALVSKELETMAPQVPDVLRDIVTQLGSLHITDQDLASSSKAEITLTLEPRFSHVEDPDAEDKALLVQTKRCVLYIIRVQEGKNLMEILVKQPTEKDEGKWQELLLEEMPNQKGRTPYAENLFYDLAEMSYAEMKHMALQNILNLEKIGKITRQNGYQDLLNSIATDIRTKHRRRIQRQNELESTRHTLSQLEEKAEFLKEQLAQYETVIDQNKKTMQTNKGTKKTPLPFTKQYFHVRDLQRSGRMPRFGSYKYSATRLVEKGILVGVQHGRHSEKLHLTISSDDVGVFLMEMTSSQYNEDVQTGSEEIKLEDLLQLQYNSVQTVKMMTGTLELHVDRLVQFIYKKFYQT